MGALAWVTGSGGLIGNYIVRAATELGTGWEVRALTRSQLDLCEYGAVRQAYLADRPRLVIHCAALSKSPDCQANPVLARRINVEATLNLAELAAEAQFVFFSTDLVFDGKDGGYDEGAQVNPLSVYAEPKVAAKLAVLSNPGHTVVRTSLTGGRSPTGDRGFNEQLCIALRNGESPRLFTDEYRCPLAASVTARAVWEMVAKELRGLYHLAGAEKLSRWQIGSLLAAHWRRPESQVMPGSLKDYSGPPRPPDTSLDCGKVQKELSFALPGFGQWLAEHPDPGF
jgi:dTDP-4-dehydrorhamnose reductase